MSAVSAILARLQSAAAPLGLGQAGKWAVLASLIGLATGLVAVGFEWLLHTVEELLIRRPTGIVGEGLDVIDEHAWMVLAIPTLGGLAAGFLTWWFAPEATGHGTDAVIKAFHRAGGRIRRRVIFVKAFASALTIGSGGSAGREGPVAQVGAGVGSAVSDSLKLSDRDRRVFLLAGAAAGVGAMFTAPLGGALFMAEAPYRKVEFEGEPLVPCIISSIVAYTTFTTITGKERALDIAPAVLERLTFDGPLELVVYLVLGVVCALVGWAYTKTFYGVHDFCDRSSRTVPLPFIAGLGGLALGGLSLGLTAATGTGVQGVLFGGYALINGSIAGTIGLGAIALLVVAKILATTASIASGGSGGIFAPSLAIGALIGAFVGQAGAELLPAWNLDPASFALVGMGGFFAGIAKAPITSVIMVSEMTGNYQLLAPLMLVSVVHVLLSRGWTAYREQVPGHVDSPAHAGEYVVDVLENMSVADVVDAGQKPVLISETSTLRQALAIVSTAQQSYFPVIDDRARLVGIFSLTDVRRIFRENVIEDFVIVRDFMVERVATVRLHDNLDAALRTMTEYHVNTLPVVDDEDGKIVLTLLDRQELGKAYAARLRELRGSES